jgi:hypothetical protein
MKQNTIKHIILFLFLLVACTPIQSPQAGSLVDVYATPATQTWMGKLYDCAASQSPVLRLVDSPSDAAIYLRLGTPDHLAAPVFQIDTEDVLVVTNKQSTLQNMDVNQVRALFAGQGDPSVQVWVYSDDNDIQQVFGEAVMEGMPVTSLARLAVSPQQMSDAVNSDANVVGILPGHWKVGDSRSVYTIPDIPVLAITKEEPQGIVKDLVACLQR